VRDVIPQVTQTLLPMASKSIPKELEPCCQTARLMPLTLDPARNKHGDVECNQLISIVIVYIYICIYTYIYSVAVCCCRVPLPILTSNQLLMPLCFFVAIVRLRSEDVTVKEPKQFAIRWRIAGTANVPFPGLKIKPYIVPRFSAVSQTQEKR
jgi:hypothetical protein